MPGSREFRAMQYQLVTGRERIAWQTVDALVHASFILDACLDHVLHEFLCR